MPLQATSGAATYDAFGGGVPYVPTYIEEVFQNWLYTGTGSTLTITNGIDLAGKGGMVWTKSRSNATSNIVFDTAMGGSSILVTNDTSAIITTSAPPFLTFNSNGFSFNKSAGGINQSPDTYASWTFRDQPKFFDVVTWTGNGATFRDIPHNLQSVPGCVMIKRTDGISNWNVWHRSLGATFGLRLNTADEATDNIFASPFATSTSFQALGFNDTGRTFVAYVFAHNAGGFGLTGTDNVITCGAYTGNGSTTGPTVNLGYEPQWVLLKRASGGTANWVLVDNMRGMVVGGDDPVLIPNTNDTESGSDILSPTATGFQITTSSPLCNGSGNTIVYIAIRRGPMRTPTTGTSVFSPLAVTPSTNTLRTIGFASDLNIAKGRTLSDGSWVQARLTGFASDGTTGVPTLLTPSIDSETTGNSPAQYNYWNTTARDGAYYNTFSSVFYNFGRAPGFMDVVCASGSVNPTNHNLGVAPELIIRKRRDFSSNPAVMNWSVTSRSLLGTGQLILNSTAAYDGAPFVLDSVTSTQINWGSLPGGQMVLYLFASCPGVSKVGTFTGTGSTQVINCGFTGGARFVLIKATSTTGNWFVWDSARGIVAGNDPYLLLNSTAAEVTNTDWVDTAATGFELSNAGGNLANSNGVSYIYLAIA